MKKFAAFFLACAILFTTAFALPINTGIMPHTGYFDTPVTVAAGKTWTSSKYEIEGAANYVYLEVAVVDGGNTTVELYGSNSLSGAGIKVGSASTVGTNTLSVRHNYSYYHFKVVNNSKQESTTFVMLYT